MNRYKNNYLLAALVAHVVASIFSIGVHHPDELFQIFEFAGYKLGMNTAEELPWEFAAQMRSGWQPLIVYAFSKLCYLFGLQNPFIIATLVRFIHGLFSLYLSVKLLVVLEKEITIEPLKKALWYAGLLFWVLPYFQVHFSSESFGIDILIVAFLLYFNSRYNVVVRFLAIGFLFATAFLVRFQLAFMVAGFGLWLLLISKIRWQQLVLLVFGFVAGIGLGVIIDYWLYGKWLLSSWYYLEQNLFHDMASQFGTQPFYFFLTESFVQLAPPLTIVIYAALFWFWFKQSKHWLTWITLPFIILHFPIAHKETRFLMPVLPFIPFIAVYYYQQHYDVKSKWWQILRAKWFIKLCLLVNALALVVVCVKPADPTTQTLGVIYDVVQGEKVLMYYDHDNPYEWGSLNYFRKKNIKIVPRDCDTSGILYTDLYFIKENLPQNDTASVNGTVFKRVYSNYPDWIYALNFNGWVDRSGKYSIYKSSQ